MMIGPDTVRLVRGPSKKTLKRAFFEMRRPGYHLSVKFRTEAGNFIWVILKAIFMNEGRRDSFALCGRALGHNFKGVRIDYNTESRDGIMEFRERSGPKYPKGRKKDMVLLGLLY